MPDDGPSVAILIPSRNHGPRLKTAIDSLARTTYRNYKIYVIDNDSDDPATLRYLASLPHRVLRIPSPGGRFSFAAVNNRAAAMVKEDLLLFLNDDTEVINPRWLSQMVGWSRLEGVGAVGARLLFPNDRVQHAGVVHEFHDGLSGHAFRNIPATDVGTMFLPRVSRNVMAVTAACMLTPRKLFAELGGFDEERFAVAYNDPDYCYRLADAGYRSVYCAEAELYHHEGLSRGFTDDPRELAAFREVHGHRLDPYFSPHFDPEIETFETKPTVVPLGSGSRPIPLLAVTHNLNWEGAPRVEYELVRGLHRSGVIRAEVLSPVEGPLRRAYEQEGIPIRVEPALVGLCGPDCTRKLYREATARLAGQILDGGYELVHANTLQTFWAVEAARRAGLPSVWSVHESEPWQICYQDMAKEIVPLALACLSYPYRVVFTARSSAEVWGAFNTSGNFELIRVARDHGLLRSVMEGTTRSQARDELGLAPDDLCVLLLGTVCERKGQHDLLGAFAALPGPIAARVKCIVVGARDTVEYSRKLEALARELPDDRRDRFVIVPETGETSAYWQAADVFCCTSRIESYPLVILEAMAASLPIITTPVYGISEQVRPDVNALIYQPGDIPGLARHLSLLARDDARRRSLAEASPHVFRSLPDDARMHERYRRTFQGAAESAPLFPAPPLKHAKERSGRGPSRIAIPVTHGAGSPTIRRDGSHEYPAPRDPGAEALHAHEDVAMPPEIDSLLAALEAKDKELQDLRDQLRAIHNSDAWAILRTLGQLRYALAPHGTMRDRLTRQSLRGLRRIKKLAMQLSRAPGGRPALDPRGRPRPAPHRGGHPAELRGHLPADDRVALPLPAPAAVDAPVCQGEPPGAVCGQPVPPRDRGPHAADRDQRPGDDPAGRPGRQRLPAHALSGGSGRDARGDRAARRRARPGRGDRGRPAPLLDLAGRGAAPPVRLADRLRLHGRPRRLPAQRPRSLAVRATAGRHGRPGRRQLGAAPRGPARTARSAILIRNACEYEHFAREFARPPASRGGPTIGYYGAIAEWFDSELVAELARIRPGWRFELIGSTLAGNIRPLVELGNVRLLGECPYADLPGRIAGWDATIIPFRRVPLTEATNPVKVYEMLATGKPVVAVGLPELVPIAEDGLIRLAATAEEFAEAIERELRDDDDPSRERRRAFASRNTWPDRHRELAVAVEAIRRRLGRPLNPVPTDRVEIGLNHEGVHFT